MNRDLANNLKCHRTPVRLGVYLNKNSS